MRQHFPYKGECCRFLSDGERLHFRESVGILYSMVNFEKGGFYMSKRLLLIMNSYAGKRMGRRYLADILEKFCRAEYVPTVLLTAKTGDGHRLAARYGGEADLVVCMGGDGTFNEVVSGLLEQGLTTPVGYIPCGSTNDFAGSIGLPRDLLKAADNILEGEPHTYDVGSFDGRYFTYVASFGAFTRASYATPQNTKNVLGHLAYILEGMKDLPAIRPWHLRFETEGAAFEGDYIFGAVSNSTSVGGILALDPKRVDMNDGLLELLLVRMPANAAELNDCIRALQEKNYDLADAITFHSASRLTVEADPAMDWTLDGEREPGRGTIDIQNVPNAIRLMAKEKGSKS